MSHREKPLFGHRTLEERRARDEATKAEVVVTVVEAVSEANPEEAIEVIEEAEGAKVEDVLVATPLPIIAAHQPPKVVTPQAAQPTSSTHNNNEESPVGGRLAHFKQNWAFNPWA